MSKTEVPWRVLNLSGKSFFVERGRYRAIHFLSLEEAEAKANELNKLEAVREAAPELLAACKALMASVHVAAKDNTNSVPLDMAIAIRGINDAVRHAESFP